MLAAGPHPGLAASLAMVETQLPSPAEPLATAALAACEKTRPAKTHQVRKTPARRNKAVQTMSSINPFDKSNFQNETD